MRTALILRITLLLLVEQLFGDQEITTHHTTTTPETTHISLEDLPTEGPKVIQPFDGDLPDSAPGLQEDSEVVDGESIDSEIIDSEITDSESLDSASEVDIHDSDAEPEEVDKPAEKGNSGQGGEELPEHEEDEDDFVQEDSVDVKIPQGEQPRRFGSSEVEEDVGPEIDIIDPEVGIHTEEPGNIAELVITEHVEGLISCEIVADRLIYHWCNLSVWVNDVENSTATNVYQASTQIFETDTVKCKAHCSTASGIVTMTARHGPTAIFTMPIIILIAIGGILFISTLGILIYFIRKSRRRRKKGYHFPLTGNTVEAYNLEVDIGPPVTCTNGTQVVVSDSYNLVDG